MREVVVTTYLGHRVELRVSGVTAYTPDGHLLGKFDSMATIRKMIQFNRRTKKMKVDD